MRRARFFPILLLIVSVSLNEAEISDKVLFRGQKIQDFVNSYLQDIHAHANYSHSSLKDVDVFAKGDSNSGIGLPMWSRPKAKEYEYTHVKSKEDVVNNGGGDIVEDLGPGVEPTPPFIISQFLSPKTKPSVPMTLSLISHKNIFRFEVEKDLTPTPRYYISVVVEKMNCSRNDDKDNLAPVLIIKGDQRGMKLCEQFDSSTDSFQSVNFYLDGNRHVTITGFGNWSSVTATMIVSIYYETLDGCESCSMKNHFCCGSEKETCQRSSYSQRLSKGFTYEQTRCIPKGSLLCDGHPNCGFRCNLDESQEICPNDENNGGEGDYNTCYTCRDQVEDRYLVTLILLIVFCLFVPFCIFLVFCSRKDIQRELRQEGRCPLPFEILLCPFSMNPENENRAAGNNRVQQTRNPGHPVRDPVRVANIARQVQTGQENFSYFDDLPPPYSECCNNKCLYPNPPKSQENVGVGAASQVEFRGTSSNAPSSSVNRTVPTVSLQVLTISSLLNERPPPSFEVVVSEKRSRDSKKQSLTHPSTKFTSMDVPDLTNNLSIAETNNVNV